MSNLGTILHTQSRLKYIETTILFHTYNPLLSAKLNATGQRWVNKLADFNIKIHYKPGRHNTDADSLSRFPEDIKEYKRLT